MKVPQPGEVLADKYRVERTLGEGGFGVVLLATTLSTGRPVALKLMKARDGKLAVTHARRFLREMRAIAQLQSPHTLTLYDFGRTDDGVLYMVCEYVEGEDLLALIGRRDHLAGPEVVWILYQALQSLSEAHDAGILHRDIKPSNIRIFSYEADPLRVKMLDFGLAKSLEPGESRLTGTGKVIGTPRYMSPEQLRGEELTGASDIFSLGIVAVEMLLGREATALTAGVARNLTIGPEPAVAPALRAIVNRMVAPNPQDRYASAAEVLHDLRPLRGRPLTAASSRPAPIPEAEATRPTASDPSTAVYMPRSAAGPQVAGPQRSLLLVLGGLILLVIAAGTTVSLLSQKEAAKPGAQTRVDVPFVQGSEPPPEPAQPPDMGASEHVGCGSPHAPGRMTLHDTEPVWWNVHIPRGYTSTGKVPLVILLADPMNGQPAFIEASGFAEVADREGFVVAAPGLQNLAQVKLWDDTISGDYLAGVVDELDAELCIDPDRIFIYGEGQGGDKMRWVGCQEWVAAMATHHGRPKNLEHCEGRQVPYLHFAPLDSEYLPLDGERRCLRMTSGAVSIDEHDRWWAKRNGCSTSYEELSRHKNVTCHEYEDCDTRFASCRTSGGFGWPDSKARQFLETFCPKEPPAEPFPAADIAWDFFNSTNPGAPRSNGTPGCGKAAPGVGLTHLTTERALERTSVTAYVPESYDPNRPHPVMLLLHRDGQSGEQAVQMTKFAQLAEDEGFIIVAPDDTDGGLFAWRSPRADIALLRDDFAVASNDLCIDTQRVFAVGHGSGGFAIGPLSCEPWVTAVAMNSSRAETRVHACAHAAPSIHLSPMKSERMLVQGGKGCMVAAEPLPLAVHEARWAQASGCEDRVAKSTEYKDGRCMRYANCDAPFVSCHLDGGYGWPGSRRPPPDLMGSCGDIPTDFPAERVIWDFFEEVSR